MSDNGYQEALEAAGATVHVFESFGSYQGDWWGKVTHNGATGWINGGYGSCSGCDAFEAEFGYDEKWCEEHIYNEKAAATCPAFAVKKVEYQKKLAAFGAGYLDDLMTQGQAEAKEAENLEWDDDAEPMVRFIKEHA